MKILLGFLLGACSVVFIIFIVLLDQGHISISLKEQSPVKTEKYREIKRNPTPKVIQTQEQEEIAAIKAVDEAIKKAKKTTSQTQEKNMPTMVQVFGKGGEIDRRVLIDKKSPDEIFTVSISAIKNLKQGDTFLSPEVEGNQIKYIVMNAAIGEKGLLRVYAGREEDLSYVKISVGNTAATYTFNIEGKVFIGRSLRSSGVLYSND